MVQASWALLWIGTSITLTVQFIRKIEHVKLKKDLKVARVNVNVDAVECSTEQQNVLEMIDPDLLEVVIKPASVATRQTLEKESL